MAGPKGKGSEKLRRTAKTLFFMLTMLFSLLFLSIPILFAAADATVAVAITTRLAGGLRRTVLDVILVAVGRSIVVACTYASYKGTGLANAPYLRVITLCCASSFLFLFVKACLFNPTPQIDNGAPPLLAIDHLHCKMSRGVAALFVSSMVFALGHVIIAYRTTNRARRKMYYRLDPEAVLGCKRVLCGFQKVPRSPTPGTGRVSKYSSETRRKLLLRDNHDVVPISLLADLDSCFIACHDLTVHYKLSSYDSCHSVVSSPYAESSGSSSPTSMSSENLNFDKSMTSSPKAHINRSLSNQFTTTTLYTPLLPVSATSRKKVSEETPTFYLGDDYDKDLCPTSSINFDVDVEDGGKFGIVLVHGFGGGVFSWRHVSRVLARQVGCPVVAFDRPGWGLTSRPCRKDWENRQLPNPYELETQVDLLLSFCSALGFSSVVLVGHDDGALLALKAAEKIRTSPDSISVEIKGVVLLGVSLSREVVPSFARILLHTSLGKKHMVRPLLRTEITQVINRRAWYDATKLTTEVLNLYKAPLYVEGWEEALHEIGRLSFSTVLSQQNADALLESVKNLPVLVVMGAEDALVPFKSAQVLASKLTHSRLVAIPGCGHLPHEECPRELLEALSPFITRLLSLQDEYERR